jgi:hypothetical protein
MMPPITSKLQVGEAAAPPDVVSHLESLGVDQEAQRWLYKALHPPGSTHGHTLPDASYLAAIVPDYRTTVVITKDPTLPAGNWDLIVVKTPGDVVGALVAMGPAGTDFSDPGVAVTVRSLTRIQGTVFGSVGGMSNVTPVAGVVTANGPKPYSTVGPEAKPIAWRKTASSLTAYMTASAIADQGTVYAMQLHRDYVPTKMDFGVYEDPGLAGSNVLVRRHSATMPLRESDMMLIDPKTYTNNARAGAFIPLRLSGPVQPLVPRLYAPSGGFSTTLIGAVETQYEPYSGLAPAGPAPTPEILKDQPINATADISGISVNSSYAPTTQLPDPSRTLAVGTPVIDSGYDNVHTGIIIFRGLDSSASITLKLIDTIEMVPMVDSPFKQFVEAPNRFSPTALGLYHALVQATPDVYPADYNSLGKVWGVIKRVAREIWPVVKKDIWPAVKPAIPKLIEAATRAGMSSPPAMAAMVSYRAPPGPGASAAKAGGKLAVGPGKKGRRKRKGK